MTVQIITTDCMRTDITSWLSKVCDDGYGKIFDNMSPEDQAEIVDDLLSTACRKIEHGRFTLTLREKYQRSEVEYSDFKIEPGHFEVQVTDDYTDEVHTLGDRKSVVAQRDAANAQHGSVSDTEMLNWLLGRLRIVRNTQTQDVWQAVSFAVPHWDCAEKGQHDMREIIAQAMTE